MMTKWVGYRNHAWTLATAAVLTATSASAQPTAPEPPPPVEPWYEALDFGLFADAYYSLNTNLPKPQEGSNTLHAYDTTNGFAFSWVGADVSYDPQPVGGTISLRFGPTAEALADSCASEVARCDSDVQGLTYVKQAFASWQPLSGLTFDFGKFDTIYGAELAESQDNFNYSRGAVYWLAQPAFHTGIRSNIRISPALEVNALVVNGWNNSIDNNAGKTIGLQAVAQPIPQLSIALGWLGGPEQDDMATLECPEDTVYTPEEGWCTPSEGFPASTHRVDRGDANQFEAWKHLADVVVAWDPSPKFSMVLNGDYGVEGVRSINEEMETEVDSQSYFGIMLGARYALTDVWAVAARGEYFEDPDGYSTGFDDLKLATGTLTIGAAPTPNLLLRLEGRGDFALDANVAETYWSEEGQDGEENDIFPTEVREDVSHQITATFSVVVRL